MKKIISLALALIMICGAMIAFASCEKKGDTLVMATNAAFPPYEYKEGDAFAGIDVEIATAIAEKLGMDSDLSGVEFIAGVTYSGRGVNAAVTAAFEAFESVKGQ